MWFPWVGNEVSNLRFATEKFVAEAASQLSDSDSDSDTLPSLKREYLPHGVIYRRVTRMHFACRKFLYCTCMRQNWHTI